MSAEKTDHKAEALECLREAGLAREQDRDLALHLQGWALVHSNLAIAEGQERVAEEVKAFRELMAGSAT